MNILLDELPVAIKIGKEEYPINSDFRTGIRIISAFEDVGLTVVEKQALLIKNLYIVLPEDFFTAAEKAIKFLNGGQIVDEDDDEGLGFRLYSFSKDSNYIYAAFKQTHNIDLESADMHWWKFLALFMDLGSETTFCGLISLRKRLKTGKATKEEKAMAEEMRSTVELPEYDSRTFEERLAEENFMKALSGAKRG